VRLEDHLREDRGVELDLDGPRLAVEALAPEVLRVRFSATGRWRPRRSWAGTHPAALEEPVAAEIETGGMGVSLLTPSLIATVDEGGRLAIRSAGGNELFGTPKDGGPRREADGSVTRWATTMPDGRRYFGFGERTGLLEKRGRRYTCWTTDEWHHQAPSSDSLYVAVPFFLALDPGGEAFGIYLDSTFRSAFDLTDLGGRRLVMEVADAELGWYLIHGPTPGQVVTRLTALLGRCGLPPRWALGYHQARWSYGSEAEVREVAAGLREHAIPADAIHLDIDHMDGFRVFTWDSDRFPDPVRMTAELRAVGLRTTVVVDAAVKQDPAGYEVYVEGKSCDAFVKESDDPGSAELTGYLWGGLSVLPDHTRPDVRTWWGALYRRYLEVGVAGFLDDMNEPAMHDRPFDDPRSDNTEPASDTPFGPPDERTTHAEVRNVYASLEDQGAIEGLLDAQPDRRPFLVTRAGFAGIQRHAVVWTGDNGSYWEHLEMSLPQLLNLGLSGVGLAGADIGGFFGDCTPELLVRWMQLGAFYPFARNNSARGTARQEPWVWGEPTTSRCRRALELRYRLLPYLYTVVREATERGWPILRPLFFHHPEHPVAQQVEDEAFVGRDLLIAPVTRPGKVARDVWLPPGAWWDLRTWTRLAGDQVVLASAELDEGLPIFAREGAIVPMGPIRQWTDEAPVDPLELRVLLDLGGTASGSLYEDDGETLAYRRGGSCVTRFEATREAGAVVITGRREGAHEPAPRHVVIRVHGDGGARQASTDDARDWRVAIPLSGEARDR
jgi:alpha-glucosidase